MAASLDVNVGCGSKAVLAQAPESRPAGKPPPSGHSERTVRLVGGHWRPSALCPAAYVMGQSAGARAAPLTELATYGLDHDTFLGRPVVAAYCSRFGVEREHTRITGA